MYRALARAGKAYLKKDDDESALRYLNKSLSEHRTPEISKLILEVSVTYDSIKTFKAYQTHLFKEKLSF